ncbi:MAG: hypothetical protein LBP93_03945 [Treponema sp.]|jgi:hypothetical protein|nr:hypothetical protein [Treponema sp.]
MPELTEEEADALDEYYTTHIPKTGPNGTGFISRRNARFLGLDNLTMDYIWTKAEADHKSPAQIIGDLVREKIATASA